MKRWAHAIAATWARAGTCRDGRRRHERREGGREGGRAAPACSLGGSWRVPAPPKGCCCPRHLRRRDIPCYTEEKKTKVMLVCVSVKSGYLMI
jgi:hypothetical protein